MSAEQVNAAAQAAAEEARDEHDDEAAAGMAAMGRLGGYARALALTSEQLSEANRRAVNTRWDRERARRAAEGLPPLNPTPRSPLSEDEMEYWLAEVDRRFPGREFDNRMQRRRLAVRLARDAAARLIDEALRGGTGKAGA